MSSILASQPPDRHPAAAGAQYQMYIQNQNSFFGFTAAIGTFYTPTTVTGGGNMSYVYYSAASTSEKIILTLVNPGVTVTLETVSLTVFWINDGFN